MHKFIFNDDNDMSRLHKELKGDQQMSIALTDDEWVMVAHWYKFCSGEGFAHLDDVAVLEKIYRHLNVIEQYQEYIDRERMRLRNKDS